MTETSNKNSTKMYIQDTNMKLASSASEQNVYFAYVCLVNDIKPNNFVECGHIKPSLNVPDTDDDDAECNNEPIQVERSKALHELIESHKNDEKEVVVTQGYIPESSISFTSANDLPENADCNLLGCDNFNILKLTKMKWLSEDKEASLDSSSPSLSPASSISNCSMGSQDYIDEPEDLGDKYLSTILRLDREHNLFGLSNIAIIGARPSKKIRKDDDKAVFHQTAIVQICCGGGCCRHKSNTDMPSSLKCGGCRGCCIDPLCSMCVGPCSPPCKKPPWPPLCPSCPSGKCKCKLLCPPPKCLVDCATCFGLRITLNRKPKYEPAPCELTPRASCVLLKPFAARSCHHLPQCIPPSSCFPYLMPCFWPARPSAPCNSPARCFHNPPCLPPRIRRGPLGPDEMCVKFGKCTESAKKKCTNLTCIGNNPALMKEIESRFGRSKDSESKNVTGKGGKEGAGSDSPKGSVSSKGSQGSGKGKK